MEKLWISPTPNKIPLKKVDMKWLFSMLAKHTQSMKDFEVYGNKELNIIQNSCKTLKEVGF